MSMHVSFHNPKLIEVKVVDNDLTSLDIYDSDEPYGTRLVFYFNNPLEVAEWANKIWASAHKANKLHNLNKVGV